MAQQGDSLFFPTLLQRHVTLMGSGAESLSCTSRVSVMISREKPRLCGGQPHLSRHLPLGFDLPQLPQGSCKAWPHLSEEEAGFREGAGGTGLPFGSSVPRQSCRGQLPFLHSRQTQALGPGAGLWPPSFLPPTVPPHTSLSFSPCPGPAFDPEFIFSNRSGAGDTYCVMVAERPSPTTF